MHATFGSVSYVIYILSNFLFVSLLVLYSRRFLQLIFSPFYSFLKCSLAGGVRETLECAVLNQPPNFSDPSHYTVISCFCTCRNTAVPVQQAALPGSPITQGLTIPCLQPVGGDGEPSLTGSILDLPIVTCYLCSNSIGANHHLFPPRYKVEGTRSTVRCSSWLNNHFLIITTIFWENETQFFILSWWLLAVFL